MDHRRRLDLTRDEPSYTLSLLGHILSAAMIRRLEHREYAAIVDELVALDTTPIAMLTHIPSDAPLTDGPIATGLPEDMTQRELVAWMHGHTALDHHSRILWAESEVTRLRIAARHHEDQLRGAKAELGQVSCGPSEGALADDLDAPAATTMLELHERVSDCDYAHSQTATARAYAEQRPETLQARYEQAPFEQDQREGREGSDAFRTLSHPESPSIALADCG